MDNCKVCGSFAINQNSHGRAVGADLDLCDVCYWRKRVPKGYGYLREDNDCHKYIIPEGLIEDFSILNSKLDGVDWMDGIDDYEEFEKRFGEYRVEGRLYDLKIVMEDNDF